MRGLNLFSLIGIKRSTNVYWVRYWPIACNGAQTKRRGFLEKVLEPSWQTFFNKLSFRRVVFGKLSNNWNESLKDSWSETVNDTTQPSVNTLEEK